MKNKEKYFDEILKAFSTDGDILEENCNFRQKHIKEWCAETNCDYCSQCFKEWLEQEYIEPITLTEDEKVILKNVDKQYKWIARDPINLRIFVEEPYKDGCEWTDDDTYYENLYHFNHLFQFIKWEDDSPYNIDELLKQNGVER